DGVAVEQLEEPGRAAAVLDVGAAVGARGAEIGRVAQRDVGRDVGRYGPRKSPLGFARRPLARGTVALLGAAHRRGEHGVVGVGKVGHGVDKHGAARPSTQMTISNPWDEARSCAGRQPERELTLLGAAEIRPLVLPRRGEPAPLVERLVLLGRLLLQEAPTVL